MGTPGATGAQGPTGEQGVQGPAGTVLVLDGGVVVGPAGSSVVVTPIPVGGATCPTGGLRVTQVSDGGINNVCNGELGPQGVPGPQGPAGLIGATGAQGPAGAVGGVGPVGPAGPTGATGSQGPAGAVGGVGPAGPQGASGAPVTVTVLASMSPQCITGGVRIGYPDGGSSAVCNGAQGPQGLQGVVGPAGSTGTQGIAGPAGPAGPAGVGAVGPAGPTGPMGATGPSGPPGAGYFVDGGVARADFIGFAGFTVNTYTGNLGGNAGANQKCNAEFPDSFLCTYSDYARSESAVTPNGAWIDSERNSTGTRGNANCYVSGSGGWVNSASDTGYTLNAFGGITSGSCTVARPLSCCRKARSVIFRGFTMATYTGNLGGNSGSNAKCHAEYPGSFLCTYSDYARSETSSTPGTPAWIDSERNSTGTRGNANCYISGSGGWVNSASDTGYTLNALGGITSGTCTAARPLACCQNN